MAMDTKNTKDTQGQPATNPSQSQRSIVLVQGAGTGHWCVTNDAALAPQLRKEGHYREASGPELETLRSRDATFAQVYNGIFSANAQKAPGGVIAGNQRDQGGPGQREVQP